MIDELLKYQEADGRLRAVEREISSTEEHKKYMTALKFLKKAPEKLEALDVKATELRRAFERLSKSDAAPFALVSEYGHLVLCGGRAEDVRAYAEYSALTYARMYRLADEKPGREEQQAAKTEQKERLAEEKRLSGALSPFRQFDRFSPADLPFLADKHIFVSERMYRTAASGKDWDAARKQNTVEIVRSPALGR